MYVHMYARVYTGFATPHFTLGYNCYYEFSFHQPDCKLINNKKKNANVSNSRLFLIFNCFVFIFIFIFYKVIILAKAIGLCLCIC